MEVEDGNLVMAPPDGTFVGKDGSKMDKPDLLSKSLGHAHLYRNEITVLGKVCRRLHFLTKKEVVAIHFLVNRTLIRVTSNVEDECLSLDHACLEDEYSLADLCWSPILEKSESALYLQGLTLCQCASGEPLLTSLRTTYMSCICNSLLRGLEQFARNFNLCPLTLQKVHTRPVAGDLPRNCFARHIDVPFKLVLKMDLESLDDLDVSKHPDLLIEMAP